MLAGMSAKVQALSNQLNYYLDATPEIGNADNYKLQWSDIILSQTDSKNVVKDCNLFSTSN